MEVLKKGFISIDQCIQLIQKHTTEEPLVDLPFLAANWEYIEHGHNFTVHLVEKDAAGKKVAKGTVWVEVKGDREKYNLRAEIKEAVKRVYNMDLNLEVSPIRNMSTVVDPQTNAQGRPVRNDPLAKDLGYNVNHNSVIA